MASNAGVFAVAVVSGACELLFWRLRRYDTVSVVGAAKSQRVKTSGALGEFRFEQFSRDDDFNRLEAKVGVGG